MPLPRSIDEILDPQREFEPAVIDAVAKFKRSKPWRGTAVERLEKFKALNADLAAAYEMASPPELIYADTLPVAGAMPIRASGRFIPERNAIAMWGKLSVVTYLHVFCIARGQPPRERFAWSINLFAKMFPVSFARARADGLNLFAE